MKTSEGVICEVLFLTLFYSNISNNGASEGVMGETGMKFFIEALTSKVKRMFRAKLEQFHERV